LSLTLIFGLKVLSKASDNAGMGAFAEVCSKNARPPRKLHFEPHIPSSSLGSAVSSPQRALASKSENFRLVHFRRLHPFHPLDPLSWDHHDYNLSICKAI
jgi:hypothetical protein